MAEPPTGLQPNSDDEIFKEAVDSARSLKEKYVDPRIGWYKNHTATPRWMFRLAGISTILLSVTLPALAAGHFSHKELIVSAVSIAIAALTGLGSFYRWERTWHGNSTAQLALEHLVAKWELELTNAKLLLDANKRSEHVYLATNDLLTNSRSVVSSEAEGFFSLLQAPQKDTPSKP
jgi:hypothetical protein